MLEMGAQGKGPIAIVGANGVIKTIYSALTTMDRSVGQDVYFVDSVDEARRVLNRRMTRATGKALSG
jgi:hypothetical protein